MNLKWIRNFVEVARIGNVTRAASQLNIAQPALSRQIRQLEAALGVKLLEKEGRGIVVTESGLLALRYAERITGTVDRLAQETKARAAVPTGAAALGAPPSIGQILFSPLIRRYRAEYPDVRLRFLESTSSLVKWLADGTIDLAILSGTTPTDDINLVRVPLVNERLYFVYPIIHRNFGPSCTIEDLVDLPFVFPAGRTQARDAIEAQARLLGREANIVVEAESLPLVVDLVRDRVAYSILPYSAVSKTVIGGDVGISLVRDRSIQRVMAYMADRPMSRAVSELARMVRMEFARLHEAGLFGATAQIPGDAPDRPA